MSTLPRLWKRRTWRGDSSSTRTSTCSALPFFGKGDLSVGKKRIIKHPIFQTAVDSFVFVVRHVRVIAFLRDGVQAVRPKQSCLSLGYLLPDCLSAQSARRHTLCSQASPWLLPYGSCGLSRCGRWQISCHRSPGI